MPILGQTCVTRIEYLQMALDYMREILYKDPPHYPDMKLVLMKSNYGLQADGSFKDGDVPDITYINGHKAQLSIARFLFERLEAEFAVIETLYSMPPRSKEAMNSVDALYEEVCPLIEAILGSAEKDA